IRTWVDLPAPSPPSNVMNTLLTLAPAGDNGSRCPQVLLSWEGSVLREGEHMQEILTTPLEPAGPNPLAAPTLRWGILAPGTITAVGSRDRDHARAFAERFEIPSAYGSYAELVDDEAVDVVYVASPHSLHYEHALAAISAGKHVLVEKAFTRNAFEAEEVFRAAGTPGVFVMEAMWTRFRPQFYTLRALLARGTIGEIVHVYAAHGQAVAHVPRLAHPQLAGAALLDLGVYPVSFVHHLLVAPSAVT